MIPPRYLYSAIGALVLALVSIISSWGHGVSGTLVKHDTRIESLEQSRAVHDQELIQIHNDLEEIKEILRANHSH